jgi:hypothetical protein
MPPLAYCTERDIAAYATVCAFPLIPCTLMTDASGVAERLRWLEPRPLDPLYRPGRGT